MKLIISTIILVSIFSVFGKMEIIAEKSNDLNLYSEEVKLTNNTEYWPAIFYSPHQDDEALAFGGAIREHKEAGRYVVLVLLTDGFNQPMLDLLNGNRKCSWHNTTHHFNLTMEQLIWARKVEFIESARQLGVDKIIFANDGQGFPDNGLWTDNINQYPKYIKFVEDNIANMEKKYPGSSHKLVSGEFEREISSPDFKTPAHKGCYAAAYNLSNAIEDFAFYRSNEYSFPKNQRTGESKVILSQNWIVAKRKALEQYKYFDPTHGRFAIGYHSVPHLIDAAYTDNCEYRDLIVN